MPTARRGFGLRLIERGLPGRGRVAQGSRALVIADRSGFGASNWKRLVGVNRWTFRRAVRRATSTSAWAWAGLYPLAVPAAVGFILA